MTGHVTDAMLLALHDGEPGAELFAAQRHVDSCPECRLRLDGVRTRSRQVRAAIDAVPIPPMDVAHLRHRLLARGRRSAAVPLWRRPGVQVVAAVVAVSAVAAAVGPVRSFVSRRATSAGPVTAPPVQTTPTPRQSAGSSVSFAPAGPTLTLRFDSAQAAGELVMERTTATDISAQVVSGADSAGDPMVVLPGELRLRNSTTSRASYRVLLPGAVDRVHVVVGGRDVVLGAPPRAPISLIRRPEP